MGREMGAWEGGEWHGRKAKNRGTFRRSRILKTVYIRPLRANQFEKCSSGPVSLLRRQARSAATERRGGLLIAAASTQNETIGISNPEPDAQGTQRARQ